MKDGIRKIIGNRFRDIGMSLTEMNQELSVARAQIEESGSVDRLKRIKQVEKQINTTEIAFLRACDTWGAVLSDEFQTGKTSTLASDKKNTK